MEIKLREKVRLKNSGKVGIISGWERKIDNNGHLTERYVIQLDEVVSCWYPCSAVSEMEIKVPESEIEHIKAESRCFSIRDEYGVREYKPAPKSIECECGKEKHGFASHSGWCPKKENT